MNYIISKHTNKAYNYHPQTKDELQERIDAFGFKDDDLFRKAHGNIYIYAEYLVNKYRDEAIELHNKQENSSRSHIKL